MKNIFSNTFVLFTLTVLIFSSCSKCYVCETTVTYNGTPEQISKDICTADNTEIESLEDEGYICKAN